MGHCRRIVNIGYAQVHDIDVLEGQQKLTRVPSATSEAGPGVREHRHHRRSLWLSGWIKEAGPTAPEPNLLVICSIAVSASRQESGRSSSAS
jgi:hypothetical protein